MSFHFFWDETSPHFEIERWRPDIEVRSQNEETSDLRISEKKWEKGG